MPKFTLNQMFVGITIISMCFAAIAFVIRSGILVYALPAFLIMAYFAPGAIVGALLLAPLKRPRLGMLLGIIVELLILYFSSRF